MKLCWLHMLILDDRVDVAIVGVAVSALVDDGTDAAGRYAPISVLPTWYWSF